MVSSRVGEEMGDEEGWTHRWRSRHVFYRLERRRGSSWRGTGREEAECHGWSRVVVGGDRGMKDDRKLTSLPRRSEARRHRSVELNSDLLFLALPAFKHPPIHPHKHTRTSTQHVYPLERLLVPQVCGVAQRRGRVARARPGWSTR